MTIDYLTLNFKGNLKSLESKYRDVQFQNTLILTRWVLIGGMFLYGIFGFLDYFLSPEYAKIFWLIRFGCVIPFAAIVLGLSYTKIYKSIHQVLLFLAYLIAGLGIQWMIVLSKPPVTYSYYAGIILVIIIVNTLVPFRFIWSVFCSLFIIASYEILARFYMEIPFTVLISNSFFFISAVIICVIAAYVIQYKSRKNFYLSEMLTSEKLLVDNLNQQLEEHVSERTRELVIINKKLRDSERRYREVIENINDVIFSLDPSGLVKFITPVIEDIIGYTVQEVVGKHFIDFVFESDRNEVMQRFIGLKNGKVEPLDYRLVKKSGGFVWIKSSTKPILENGEIIEMHGSLHDITISKNLEKQLEQARRLESIGTLAGGIAHDFNNILAAILGYSELAQRYIDVDSKLYSYVSEIENSGKRARDLVRQILTFARQSEDEKTTVLVAGCVKNAINLLKPTIPASIDLNYDIDSKLYITAAPSRIEQIIINLVTNAVHSMEREGGRLWVNVTDSGDSSQDTDSDVPVSQRCHVKIVISDSGYGIPKEIQGSIFEPYFTTKEVGKGSGLGLAVVHGIVADCNGEISVSSDIGEGTVFTVLLPATSVVAEKKEDSAEHEYQSGTETILVVDDETVVVEMLDQMLTFLGYTVHSFSDSPRAYEFFVKNSHDIDMIITDMAMPKMNGDRLALKCLKIREKLPILMTTGYSYSLSEETVKNLGLRGLLYKPVDIQLLTKEIRQILDHE